MFDQSFVPEPESPGKRPLSLLAAAAIQLSILSILALISVAYVGRLPIAQLRAMLILPRPPVHGPIGMREKTTASNSGVTRRPNVFVFHPATAHTVSKSQDAQQIPSAELVSGIGAGTTSTGSDMVGDVFLTQAGSPPVPEPKKTQPKQVRVGGQVAAANLIYHPQPAYPPLAKTTHVQGEVEFTAVISKSGAIEQLQLVHGHPLLVEAARQAVSQWRYRPTLLNGEPVEVVTDIVVRFALAQ